jgi:large subunit ribosomal protein L21
MTFAVFQTGGKQYLAQEGDKVRIEKIIGDYKVGDAISFKDVLVLSDDKDIKVGTPMVEGAEVKAEITKIDRLPKVTVIKYLQKSRYFKKNGHRQPFFEVKITSVK